MMRWAAAVGLALLCVACHQKTSQEAQANVSVATKNASSNAGVVENESMVPTPNETAGTLPPSGASLRFVGHWATDKANCASKPWRFTKDELTATDGPHCSIYNVSKVPGGYDLAAQCPTKVPVHTDLIKLRFAESAKAMLVESNAISPMGLIYCGK